MDIPTPVATFLELLENADGHPPLSDAKMAVLGTPERFVTIEENGNVVAIGVAATHTTADGDAHWSVETAVEPSLRFVEFETVVLAQALQLPPAGATVTAWSRRHTLDAALSAHGFSSNRTLFHMHVPLPIDEASAVEVERMQPDEDDVLVAVNSAAFSSHPEAASLDRAELSVLQSEPWFDRDGILFHRNGQSVDAFCWTKVHPDGTGEIYRIGVVPGAQGGGLGKAMVLAGFGYLADVRGCTVGSLWVDDANTAAIRLYASLGMQEVARNREFTASRDGD